MYVCSFVFKVDICLFRVVVDCGEVWIPMVSAGPGDGVPVTVGAKN
jgi:hypothetical protein